MGIFVEVLFLKSNELRANHHYEIQTGKYKNQL